MKWIIIILITLFMIPLVSGSLVDSCDHLLTPGRNCTMLTPQISCTNYTYHVLNETDFVLRNQSLTLVGSDIYKFTFNQSAGNYIVKLCDGSTRELRVDSEEDEMSFVIIGLIFIFLTSLVVLGLLMVEQMWLKVVLTVGLTIMITTLMRLSMWFVSIVFPAENGLINTLGIFYAISIRAMYLIMMGAALFLIIMFLNILKFRRRKKRDEDWEKW